MRVIAQNPEVELSGLDELEIEPGDWRLVTYLMEKPDGGTLRVESLVLAEDAVPVGGQEELNYPELGIEGPATVTAIAACPVIESGSGRLVTSTFKHSAANVIDLQIASEREPIGTTSNHPFWSEDRQDWVQAGSLKVGERLRYYTANKEADYQLTTLTSVLPRPGPEAVYNLTVEGTHTYLVGESGVLVHNAAKYGSAGEYEIAQIGNSRASHGGVFDGSTKSGKRIADGTRGKTGYEAKFVKGKWKDSAYNVANYGKSARTMKAYGHLVSQMGDYSRAFDKAVYMSNSKALLQQIRRIAAEQGYTNVITRYRP